MYFSSVFWVSALERAIKTVAQTAVGVLTAGATGLLDVDWVALVSVSGLAGLVSLLTSVAGSQVGTVGDPSLVKPEPVEYADPDEFEDSDTLEWLDELGEEEEVDLSPVPDDYEPKH